MATTAIAIEERRQPAGTGKLTLRVPLGRPGYCPRGFGPRDQWGMRRLAVGGAQITLKILVKQPKSRTWDPCRFPIPGPCGLVLKEIEAGVGACTQSVESAVAFVAAIQMPHASAVSVEWQSLYGDGMEKREQPAARGLRAGTGASAGTQPAHGSGCEDLPLAGWCLPREGFAGTRPVSPALLEGPLEVAMAAHAPLIRTGVRLAVPELRTSGFRGEQASTLNQPPAPQAGFLAVAIPPASTELPRPRGTFHAARMQPAGRRLAFGESPDRGMPGGMLMLRPQRVFPQFPSIAPAGSASPDLHPSRIPSEPRLAEAPLVPAPPAYPAVRLPGREPQRTLHNREDWNPVPFRSRARIAYLPPERAEARGRYALAGAGVQLPGAVGCAVFQGLARGAQTETRQGDVIHVDASPLRAIENDNAAESYRTRSLL